MRFCVDKKHKNKKMSSSSLAAPSVSFDPSDPAHKRLAFLELPKDMAANRRIEMLETWMSENFRGTRIADVGSFYSGSFKNRTLSQTAYVEFSSSDVRSTIAAEVATKSLKFDTPELHNVGIKKALSKIALGRNGALKDAEKLVKSDSRCRGKEVKIVFAGDRGVTVNGEYALEQGKNGLGHFVGNFSDLTILK